MKSVAFLRAATLAFTCVAASAVTMGCAGAKTYMHGEAVASGGVRVSPADVFWNGSILVVKVNVMNQGNSPVQLDRDAMTIVLADGRVVPRAEGTTAGHKPIVIDPKATETVRIDFRAKGFKWKEISAADLTLAKALVSDAKELPMAPIHLTLGGGTGAIAQVTNTQIVISDQITFRTGSADILPASDAIVAAVAQILQSHPTIKVRVEGHTDNVGPASYNLGLSKQRAASVVAALVKKGIDASRLTSDGFGAERPLDSNDTDEGRQNNRRVEFKTGE